MQFDSVTVSPNKGDTLEDCIKQVIEVMESLNDDGGPCTHVGNWKLIFNNVPLEISVYSKVEDIVNVYEHTFYKHNTPINIAQ